MAIIVKPATGLLQFKVKHHRAERISVELRAGPAGMASFLSWVDLPIADNSCSRVTASVLVRISIGRKRKWGEQKS
jgi:hypothetical protein